MLRQQRSERPPDRGTENAGTWRFGETRRTPEESYGADQNLSPRSCVSDLRLRCKSPQSLSNFTPRFHPANLLPLKKETCDGFYDPRLCHCCGLSRRRCPFRFLEGRKTTDGTGVFSRKRDYSLVGCLLLDCRRRDQYVDLHQHSRTGLPDQSQFSAGNVWLSPGAYRRQHHPASAVLQGGTLNRVCVP